MVGNIEVETANMKLKQVEVPPGLDLAWSQVGRRSKKKMSRPTDAEAEIKQDYHNESYLSFAANRFEVLKDDPEEDMEEAETDDSQWRMFRKIEVPIGAVKTADYKPKLSRESKMRFNVAKVQKPLASAAKVVEAGNDQVADDDTVRPEGGAMGETEFEVDTEDELGERKTKKMQDPKMPTKTEIEEHNLTHLPFRSWCRHCVRGRGKELPHKRVGEHGEMPELHVDMCFLGEEKDPHNTITVLVGRERSTRMTMATVVPAKSARSFTSRRLVAFMKEVGILHGDLLVKSDQEPAVKAILSDAGRVRS